MAPTAMLTVSEIPPLPDAVHVAPEVATHDHVAAVRVAGRVSAIDAPVTFDGPAFDATIV